MRLLGDSSPPAPMLNKPPPGGAVVPVGVPGAEPNAGAVDAAGAAAPAPNPAKGVELAAPKWNGEPPGVVVPPVAEAGAPKLKPDGVEVPLGVAAPPKGEAAPLPNLEREWGDHDQPCVSPVRSDLDVTQS